MSPILSTHKLSKSFYNPVPVQVLKDIDFAVAPGEFLTIMGKSGCGKSTLLYCLSTMDTDFEGEVFIDGVPVHLQSKDVLARLRNEKIGFVFQFHYLLPEFNCLQNVMIPGLRLKKYLPEEVEARAYHKLTLLGLKEAALQRASTLSGGQQQRVAIARALINEPLLILADEPTGNLDSRNGAMVFSLFQELAKQYHQTIVAVTHDNDMARISSRTIVMQDGMITNEDIHVEGKMST